MVLYRSPDYQTSFESIGLPVQEKTSNIDFQDGDSGNHLGFPIEKCFAIFDLQVTLILSFKFRVDWSFHSGKEV